MSVQDVAKVRSLIESSEQEIIFLQTISENPDAAQTFVRGAYECFRRLGEAVLLFQGEKVNHETSINVLFTLGAKTSRAIFLLERLQKLRQDINYSGYTPTSDEVADVASIIVSCWKPLVRAVNAKVERII